MTSASSTLDLTRAQFMHDVIDGLSRPWKRLSPKYFYDAIGSRLFDRISELDEYYLTRSELAIMDRHAAEISARCGPRTLLIEPGAGNLTKIRRLLNHLPDPVGYVPIDVSSEYLRNAVWRLAWDFPRLRIVPVVGDRSRKSPPIVESSSSPARPSATSSPTRPTTCSTTSRNSWVPAAG